MKTKVGPGFVLLLILLAASLAANLYQFQQGAREDGEATAVPTAPPANAQDIVADFTDLWLAKQEVFKHNWFGVNTLQNPMDVWVTQEIMQEVKPDFIIECGTYKGGSALLWASMLMHINPEGRVITIDIEDQRTPEAINHPLARERVDFILGGSTDASTVDKVKQLVGDKQAMVILDSLHTAEHVAGELAAYAPLVKPGSYIVVQDTRGFETRTDPPGWPWEACVAFAERSDGTWRIDRERESMLLTLNKYGFLKHMPDKSGGESTQPAPPAISDAPATSSPEPVPAEEAAP